MTTWDASYCLLPLEGWREPAEVLHWFAREPNPSLLASSGPEGADPEIHRWSFLSAGPFDSVQWSPGSRDDPFERLVRAVDRLEPAAFPGRPGPAPFAGGAIGYIGYGCGRAVETIEPARPAGPPPRPAAPDLLFHLYSWTLVWDHATRHWAVLATGLPEKGRLRSLKAREDAESIGARIKRRAATTAAPAPGRPTDAPPSAPILGSSLPRAAYLEGVRDVRERIARGDLYQVNLSQRLELPAPADPVAFYRAASLHSPAPFSAYLDAGPFQIVSASPERFVRLAGRRAESRPIKGTRPRGLGAEQDALLRDELASSGKDRAENVMIVDLVRNDLGRVCRPGTVRAEEVCRLESYASVHHLVSVVAGELDEGRGRADLLRALFPGGSMTGAPKVAAMQAIEQLEPCSRGVYSGALGYLSFGGGMDLSIVIRTAIVSGSRTWLQVGGGVVADSEPEAEYAESLDKAASMLRALGACLG